MLLFRFVHECVETTVFQTNLFCFRFCTLTTHIHTSVNIENARAINSIGWIRQKKHKQNRIYWSTLREPIPMTFVYPAEKSDGRGNETPKKIFAFERGMFVYYKQEQMTLQTINFNRFIWVLLGANVMWLWFWVLIHNPNKTVLLV